MDWKTRIIKAKNALNEKSPFFASHVLQMPMREADERMPIPTAATDGDSITWNKDFVDKLLDSELVGVMAHEVLHCVYKHHIRLKGRDPMLWNIAGDFVINLDLKEAGFVLPKGGLYDDRFKGMSTEQVYVWLQQNVKVVQQIQQQAGDGNGNDPGQMGGVMLPGDGSAEALRQAEGTQDIRTEQAKNFARAQNAGKLPAGLERLINNAKPAVDWKSILYRFIAECINKDYSFTKANKMYLPHEMIVPSLVSDGIPRIVFAVDTSGSVDEKLLSKFGAELNDACASFAIDFIDVVYCDAAVNKVEHFQTGDDLRLKPCGGGGTRFSPVFEWMKKEDVQASVVIYFTDLYCSDFGQEPDCPVLWACYGNNQQEMQRLGAAVPFGEVIFVQE